MRVEVWLCDSPCMVRILDDIEQTCETMDTPGEFGRCTDDCSDVFD